MNLIKWLSSLHARIQSHLRHRRSHSKRVVQRNSAFLNAQPLEERCLLTGYVVDTLVDQTYTGGDFFTETTGPDAGLSLREAIGLANTNGFPFDPMGGEEVGDTIVFDPSLAFGTIMIDGNGELEILDGVTIDGAAAPGLTIDGGSAVRIFFIDADGLTLVGATEVVEIANLNLHAGNTAGSFGDDGGAIEIFGANEIVLLDGVSISDSRADDDGGGIYNGGGTLTILDSLIEENSALDGATGSGGGIASTSGTVTIIDTTIRANEARRAGGGIEIVDGTLDTDGVTLGGPIAADGNVAGMIGMAAPGNGGGLHVSGTADVTIVGGTVQYNEAENEGGGLWNQSGATMTIEDGTLISDNIAYGSAVHDGGGGIFNNGGTLFINGTASTVVIEDNSAPGTSGSGGGIFSTDGDVTIDDTIIRRNLANRAGGGIEVIDGTVNLTTVTLGGGAEDGNNAIGGGGGPGNGGGLHVTGVATTNIHGGTISWNMAANEGGGLWNQAGAIMDINSGPAPVLIDSNLAGGDGMDNGGGGIFNNGGTLNLFAVGANPLTISRNAATGAFGSGGGIFNATGGILTADGISITNNDAERAGGGIEDASDPGNGLPAVILIDVTLDGNIAFGTGAAPGNGGGLNVTGVGSVEIIGGMVINNMAREEGGGLWNGTGRMFIDGTLVEGNFADGDMADQGGGGIFNAGGEVVVAGGAAIRNNAALGTMGSGGGIFNDIGGLLDISDTGGAVSITGNVANRAGGGIEDNSGFDTIPGVMLIGVDLSNNSAGVDLNGAATPNPVANPGNGGGLHVSNGGDVYIAGGTIIGNRAAREGGGLWNDTGNMVLAMGVAISANTASGAAADDGGGGIFNSGGSLFLDGTGPAANLITITNNLADGAAGNGGGIFSLGGSLTIDSANISVNGRQGIYGSGTGTVEILNTSVNNNDDGGLEIRTSTGTITVSDSNFNNNDADADNMGDGIFLKDIDGAITFDGVTATGNDPGVLIDTAPSFSDTDGTFSGNDDHGIQLIDIAGTVSLTRTTLEDNDADNDGSGDGLHARDGADGDTLAIGGTFTVNGATIRDTDGVGGGVWQEHGISIEGVGGATIFDGSVSPVTVTGHDRNGVDIQDGTTATFIDGTYSDNFSDAIDLNDFSGAVMLTNVTANNNTGGGDADGLTLEMVNSLTVVGGSFSGNEDSGISAIDTTGAVTVTNVTADNNKGSGSGEGLFVDTADSVTVEDGSFSGNEESGIAAVDVTGAVAVTNVSADNNTGTFSEGLFVSGADSVTVMGGSFSGNQFTGINADTITGAVALSNVTANNNIGSGSGEGVFVVTAGSLTITGGTFNNNEITGVNADSVTGAVTINGITANGNSDGVNDGDGLFVSTAGSVDVNGGSFNGNFDIGVELDNVTGTTDLDSVSATANGTNGLTADDMGAVIVNGGSYSGITTTNTMSFTTSVSVTSTDNVAVSAGTINLNADLTTVGDSVALDGSVSLGGDIAVDTTNNGGSPPAGLSLSPASSFNVDIMGTTPGLNQDQLQVDGSVLMGDPTLNINDTGFTATGNEVFVLIDNDGADPVGGIFSGLVEGTLVTVGGKPFPISYTGGDGNDVVLGFPLRELYVSVGGGGNVGNPAAGSIIIADQVTGAGTLLFDPIDPDGAPGLAFDNTGRLFASDGAGFVDNELYEIDPDTGMLLANIGTIRDANDVRVFITDLAFQPGTNLLFGRSAGFNPAGFNFTLATIDPATAIATPLGPEHTFITNGGLAFAPDGTLFASDTSNGDGFHIVDPLTGMILSTVPLTGATNGIDGLGVRDDGGGEFTVFGTAGGRTDLIVTIDPVTGITTALSPGITGFGNPADLDFRPEPSGGTPATLSLANVFHPPEHSDTSSPLKVADVIVSDPDGGTNNLSLSGPDDAFFNLVGTELFLLAGTNLDFETKPSYSVTVEVDDPLISGTPDDSTDLTLQLIDVIEFAEADVSLNGQPIADRQKVGFGIVEQGSTRPAHTFTLTNSGNGRLGLQPISVPAGFVLTSPNFTANQILAPKASVSFTVEMQTNNAGEISGRLSFANTDASESLYRIDLFGGVLAASANPTDVGGKLIIDNGDAGYLSVGGWNDVPTFGFQGDAQAAAGRDGNRTANWAFGDLTPGQFQISATWLNGSDRSQNVPVAIRDGFGGPVLSALTLNERFRPSGPVVNGRPFEILETVTLSGDTLVVEFSNTGTNNAVIADAILIEPFTPPPATPEITVRRGGSPVNDGGHVTLPTAVLGSTATQTFTVRNDGSADLVLQPISVTGTAFSIVAPNFAINQILAAGSEVTFQIAVDTSAVGTFNGTLTFASNDSDESPFDLALSATIVDPAIADRTIDDGEPGYNQIGPWSDVSGYGFNRDAKVVSSNRAGTASWTFANLAPGDVSVSTTWLNGGDRASAVPYTIRDGIGGPVLSTVLVNQRVAPSGPIINGRPFFDLGTVTLTGATLVVEISNAGADGHVIADAVHIVGQTQISTAPEITVTDSGVNVADGGSANLGTAALNAPLLTKTFTVQNTGTADLTLEPISVTGQGFSLQSANFTAGQIVAPNASAALTVGLSTNSVGTFLGNVSFANNDGDENPFDFAVTGTIGVLQSDGSAIIDDGDAGFSRTGTWTSFPTFGFDGDGLAGNGSNGVDTAEWVFGGLPAGDYEVATTWQFGNDRQKNVPYVIRDGVGGTVLATVVIDQSIAPGGKRFGGRPFENLGTFTVSSGTLVVELSTAGSSLAVIADAVRIELQ